MSLRIGIWVAALNLCASLALAGEPTVLTITVDFPGESATEINSRIASPMARLLGKVPGVTQLEIESAAGVSSARVVFGPKTDDQAAMIAVGRQLQSAGEILPPDALAPTVARGDPWQLARFWISIQGEAAALPEVCRAARQIEEKLAQISGVETVRLFGAAASDRSIVWLDPRQLAARGITAGECIRAIHDAEKPEARPEGQRPDLDAFKIAVRDGVPIRLKEVARVEEGSSRADGFAMADGTPSVLLALSTRRGAITGAMLEQELARLRSSAPAGIHATLAADLSADGMTLIDVAIPPGSSPAQSRRTAEQVSAAIRETQARCLLFSSADTTTFQVLVGSHEHPADVLRLRGRLSQRIVAQLRCCPIGGTGALAPFPVRIALLGADADGVRRWGDAVRTRLNKENAVVDPELFPGPGVPVTRVQADDAAALRMGVPAAELSSAVLLASGRALRFNTQTQAMEIRLERKEGDNPLAGIELRAGDGKAVPLAAMARATSVEEPTAELLVGAFPAVRLSASFTAPDTLASATAKCISAAKMGREAMKLPKDAFHIIDLTAPTE